MIRHKHTWRIILAFILFFVTLGPGVDVFADDLLSAEALLESMSPEERVGQLFLVTFNGTEVEEGTEIYELITRYHVGGVVLLAENDNFTYEDTVSETQQMIESLQQLEWESSSNPQLIEDLGLNFTPAYVPLFIGTKQIGNGFPGDQILREMTPLPSQMAIGASWELDLANDVGEVLGTELNALGVNLYLGPNLDVLETANSQAANSLGVNTFGGDPFWVGEMGKAFIRGLRQGSDNRILVVAQNFPGTGNSDRAPEHEVATVRKSLEQLKQIELAPYFAVTTPPVGDPGRVDAVMVSHIRYQGFQGNIRATTRPISFDSNALQQIMSLSQFATWRENGGLIISDNLGSGAVQRFFDPNDTNFEARQIVRNAFLAGNDMLYFDDMVATGDPDTFTTLTSTIEFFVQKYREDSAFARRVDSSVLRILSAKQQLFGEFRIDQVLQGQNQIDQIGEGHGVTSDVAQRAVTLISPTAQELDAFLPSPPRWYEDVVIFTDSRTVYQCSYCPPSSDISPMALSSSLISLYGPQAGGQLLQHRLSSFSFKQLTEFLDNVESETSETILTSLRTAEWVVFNTQNIDPDFPDSFALQRILANRSDLLAGKNVVVFALDSPTYLDATNISKVTAYYALYSKTPAFLEMAARVLMQEVDPPGALPVSLNAVGYDLIWMTSPDPNQVIRLELVLPEEEELEEENGEQDQTPTPALTPEPTAMPSFNIGDTITIRTGQIYDHNQNIVPDGTIVRFNFRISGEPGINQLFETTTTGGVAFFNYRIEAAGGLEINATSEPANQSETLQINISSEGVTSIIAFTPTPEISPTPTETPVPTATEQAVPTPIPTPIRSSFPTVGEWALGIIVMGVGGAMTFLVGYFWWGNTRWGIRSFLCALIGGLLSYSYLNLGGEGTQSWIIESGTLFVIEVIVAGMLIGWIGALIWWMRTEGRIPLGSQR